MPSPELAHVIDHLHGLAADVSAAVDLEENRRVSARFGDAHPSARDFEAEVREIRVEDVPCEWLLAPGADPDRRLLYIHGGGWTAGGLDSHRPLSARLSAATGCAVLAVAYRLAPEHPYPAGLDDCLLCYGWLRENGPTGAGLARSVFVAGDSAGGNLTLALLLALKQRGLMLPNAAVPISPATDFLATGDSYRTRADRDPILTMGPDGMSQVADVYLQGNANPKIRSSRRSTATSPAFPLSSSTLAMPRCFLMTRPKPPRKPAPQALTLRFASIPTCPTYGMSSLPTSRKQPKPSRRSAAS